MGRRYPVRGQTHKWCPQNCGEWFASERDEREHKCPGLTLKSESDMGFVPKGVQKKLNKRQQSSPMSLLRLGTAAALADLGNGTTQRVLQQANGEVPRRLELGITPQHICNAYDVYFDGKKQSLCTVADVDKGYIKRYVRGVGRKPVANKNGAFDMELLFGRVEIIPKGAKRDTRGLDGEDEGATDSSGSGISST